jgi:pantetheine-phosphate adenylyltransferase
MKKIAIYPGSFDPVTNGHLDIIERGRRMFDLIIVAVSQNPLKNSYFSTEERMNFLKKALRGRSWIEVDQFSGLLASFAKRRGASAIIRGLRAVSDFEYEFQMALMNRRLNKEFETVFLMPDEKYTYLSSSLVRQVSMYGGSLKGLVPSAVESALRKRSLTTS